MSILDQYKPQRSGKRTVTVPKGTLSNGADSAPLPKGRTFSSKPAHGSPDMRAITQGKPKAPIKRKHAKPGEKNSRVRLPLLGTECWAGELRIKRKRQRSIPSAKSDYIASTLIVPKDWDHQSTGWHHIRNTAPPDTVCRNIWHGLWHGFRPGKKPTLRQSIKALQFARRGPRQRILIPADLPHAAMLVQEVANCRTW